MCQTLKVYTLIVYKYKACILFKQIPLTTYLSQDVGQFIYMHSYIRNWTEMKKLETVLKTKI